MIETSVETTIEPAETQVSPEVVDESVRLLVAEVMIVERRYANELRNVQSERREGIQRVIEKLSKAEK